MGESTALPQSTTNDRVSNKICYVYMNLFTNMIHNEKKHFHLVQNRISPAVVAVVASIASVQFFVPGPIFDSVFPTDRLEQHLAHIHNPDAHTSMTTEQLPDRVHPTGSETKDHVFNNQITDNVDIYHSEATTLKPKAFTMKYTKT